MSMCYFDTLLRGYPPDMNSNLLLVQILLIADLRAMIMFAVSKKRFNY